jgi:hypothetical protein
MRDQRKWDIGDNLHLVADRPDMMIERINQICHQAKNAGLDPVWDVQIVTAVNEKSPLSRVELNRELQRVLNKQPGEEGVAFRVGDKLVNGKNSWFKLAQNKDADDTLADVNEREEVYVANGELAKVISVDKKSMVLSLNAPARQIEIYFGQEGGCTFELGYALSVHKCVHPETLVETPDGLMPIRNISQSGAIGTPDGVMEFYDRVSYENSKCLEITTKDGNFITVTLDHKCERWDGVKYSVCLASELNEGDYVRTALFSSCEPTDDCVLPQHHGSDARCRDIILPGKMTADLAEFLGMCVADGCVYRSGIKLGKRHVEVVDRFEKLSADLFGAMCIRTKTGEMYLAEIHSTILRDWILNLGGCYPKHKHVPECIIKSRKSIHAAFIRGLFEDGTVNIKNGVADHIEWSTCFPRLLNEVRTMLNRLGIIAGQNSQKTGRGLLYIYGAEIGKFKTLIGFISRFKQGRLEFLRESSAARYMVPVSMAFIESTDLVRHAKENARKRGTLSRASLKEVGTVESDAMLRYHHSKIKSIKEITGPTMCVTVPFGGKFMQNGFPWGNSQGSDWPWVVVMLDDYPGARMVCDRSWLYTAISRAKLKCWMLGNRATADRMCKQSKIWHRKTFLRELILRGKALEGLANV